MEAFRHYVNHIIMSTTHRVTLSFNHSFVRSFIHLFMHAFIATFLRCKLHLMCPSSQTIPIRLLLSIVISYFPNFRPGTWSLWYSHMGWWEWRSHGSIVSRDLVAPVAPGGIKTEEPALDHPVTQDQIRRFGGQTDPSLPWPEKLTKETGLETWTVPKKGFERTDRIF